MARINLSNFNGRNLISECWYSLLRGREVAITMSLPAWQWIWNSIKLTKPRHPHCIYCASSGARLYTQRSFRGRSIRVQRLRDISLASITLVCMSLGRRSTPFISIRTSFASAHCSSMPRSKAGSKKVKNLSCNF
jgi:hypothetical protein